MQPLPHLVAFEGGPGLSYDNDSVVFPTGLQVASESVVCRWFHVVKRQSVVVWLTPVFLIHHLQVHFHEFAQWLLFQGFLCGGYHLVPQSLILAVSAALLLGSTLEGRAPTLAQGFIVFETNFIVS